MLHLSFSTNFINNLKDRKMKRVLLLVCLCAFTTQLSAQNFFNLGNWKIKKVGVNLGMDMDMLTNISEDYFLGLVSGAPNYDYSEFEFNTENVYQEVCENPNIRMEMTLVSPDFKGVEWRFGANAIINRIDAITYTNHDGYYNFTNSQYLNFNSYGHEVSLESTVLKSYSFLYDIFRIHGGIGTNVGYAFGNSLDIYGSGVTHTASNINYGNIDEVNNTVSSPSYQHYYDYYNLPNGINQRIFLQLGGTVSIMDRLDLGLDIRRGIGYRGVFGAPLAFTMLNAFNFSLRYDLKSPVNIPFTKKD